MSSHQLSADESTETRRSVRLTRSEYALGLLTTISANGDVSQRSLSRELGIAVGLTNLLLRTMVHRGLVRVQRFERRRLRYVLTPKGLAEKARMSHVAWQNTVDRYRVVRSRMTQAFRDIAAEWPDHDGLRRVAFYGTGDLAEIGYICLHGTGLTLVGAISDSPQTTFFGVPVFSLDGVPEDWFAPGAGVRIIVASLESPDTVAALLEARGVPASAIVWI